MPAGEARDTHAISAHSGGTSSTTAYPAYRHCHTPLGIRPIADTALPVVRHCRSRRDLQCGHSSMRDKVRFSLLHKFGRLAVCATGFALAPFASAIAGDAPSREAPLAGTRPAVTALTGGDLAPSMHVRIEGEATGNIAELTGLLRDGQLSEMRTTYNGTYGASVFFHPVEMAYYVALFQDRNFWRVVKSQDRNRTSQIYDSFVRQTAELSAIEINRTELEAQRNFLQRAIALSEHKAQRLRADLDVAQTQQAAVNQRQNAIKQQTQALRVEKQAAQIELDQVRNQVRTLEREIESGLPVFQSR
jgi:hypothetical protein